MSSQQSSNELVYLGGCTVVLVLALLLGAYQTYIGVPASAEAFDDFGMKLPGFSELVVQQAWWMFPVAVVTAAAFGLPLGLVTKKPALGVGVMAVLIGVVDVAIYQARMIPLRLLLEGLQR